MPSSTYIDRLTMSIHTFVDVPLFLLSKEEQKNTQEEIVGIFSLLQKEMDDAGFQATATAMAVQSVLASALIDEYVFVQACLTFLESLGSVHDQKVKALIDMCQRVQQRSRPLWVSENHVRTMRATLTEDEIFVHDKALMDQSLQLYVLDYFLTMYALAHQAKSMADVEQYLYRGYKTLPSLLQDARSDETLTKFVYQLYGAEIRREMIRAYYTYKQPMLSLEQGMPHIQSVVADVLRQYCLVLIQKSEMYGITGVQHGIFSPYGTAIDFIALKKRLVQE